MKFALFFTASWPDPSPKTQSRVYGEMLEQIHRAEELGFDSVWLAEHHSTRFGICPSLMPMLCYIAARTRRIRLGAAVSVLTFHNPIFLAEETAMLDVLSEGRLEFGVGRGSGRYEYGNFNIDYESRTQRFNEALDIVRGLWTTPGFTYHGEYHQADGLTIAPSPIQQPHPPVYVAVSRTPASVDVAVSRGLPIITGAMPTEEDSLAMRQLYFQRCAALGKTPSPLEAPFFRNVYLHEDPQQAIEDPRAAVTWIADLGGMRRNLERGSDIPMNLDEWRRTRTQPPPNYEARVASTQYFGTPEDIAGRIRRLRDEHGINHFGASMSIGGLPHEKALRSMELFAKKVMPQFR